MSPSTNGVAVTTTPLSVHSPCRRRRMVEDVGSGLEATNRCANALARTLVANGDVDVAVVALCAPGAHRSIWRRWEEARARLAEVGIELADLPAETVSSEHQPGGSLVGRYLPEPPLEG